MIQIHKNTRNEPQSWIEYKNTPGVDYAPQKNLRNALRDEQGHICAFCMRRIPLPKRDPNEKECYKIAHLLSRRNHPNRKFDYNNMVLCCAGNINGEPHCDKSQEARDITLPLFYPQLQASISYGSYTGEISSSVNDWDIQIKDVLRLNNSLLMLNRLKTLNAVKRILKKKKWKNAKIQEIIDEWSSFDKQQKRKPYCGIVIWYLKKKLRAA